MSELDNFITRLHAIETNYARRLIELEKRPIPTDYSAVIIKQNQDILHLKEIISAQKLALESHGAQLQNLKAGLDTSLTQSHQHKTESKFSFWK